MLQPLCCPVCSSPPERVDAPTWRIAGRTTTKRGVRCAFLIGCSHVNSLLGMAIVEAPQADATVAKWNAEAERLFTNRTATWSPEHRAAYRIRLRWPEPLNSSA